jgi:hypothetical protein
MGAARAHRRQITYPAGRLLIKGRMSRPCPALTGRDEVHLGWYSTGGYLRAEGQRSRRWAARRGRTERGRERLERLERASMIFSAHPQPRNAPACLIALVETAPEREFGWPGEGQTWRRARVCPVEGKVSRSTLPTGLLCYCTCQSWLRERREGVDPARPRGSTDVDGGSMASRPISTYGTLDLLGYACCLDGLYKVRYFSCSTNVQRRNTGS